MGQDTPSLLFSALCGSFALRVNCFRPFVRSFITAGSSPFGNRAHGQSQCPHRVCVSCPRSDGSWRLSAPGAFSKASTRGARSDPRPRRLRTAERSPSYRPAHDGRAPSTRRRPPARTSRAATLGRGRAGGADSGQQCPLPHQVPQKQPRLRPSELCTLNTNSIGLSIMPHRG